LSSLPAVVLTTTAAVLHLGAAAQDPSTCNDLWPAWSPDGKRIVFVSDRTGDPEVFLRTLSGGEAQRLTMTPGRDAHPSFSPDGMTIAFQSPREGAHTNIYLMDVDGSNQRRITSHQGFAGMPVWSPDGTQIAYQWTPDLEAQKWRLMLLHVATSAQPRQLTDGSANDQVLNWAPDGTRFVFHSDRTGKNQLYTMSLDGRVTRLTTSSSDDRSGAWSPDGKMIAFMSDRESDAAGVFVMDADGTGARRLSALTPEHGVPFFSPDGARVLANPRRPAGAEVVALRVRDGGVELLSRCSLEGR
jgi:TolB protein